MRAARREHVISRTRPPHSYLRVRDRVLVAGTTAPSRAQSRAPSPIGSTANSRANSRAHSPELARKDAFSTALVAGSLAAGLANLVAHGHPDPEPCDAGAAELPVALLLPGPLAFSCACLRVSFLRDMADVATEGLDLVLTVEVAPVLCCRPMGAARLSGERLSRCWPDD